MDGRVEPAETATYQEIVSQTAAWQEAVRVVTANAGELAALWSEGAYERVILTGCGSTYYLSLAAAALFQSLTGRLARGVPAGDLVTYPEAWYEPEVRTLLIAVSRSGETTETLRAAQAFRQRRQGEVVVVTNYADRPLAELGTLTLAMPAGQEESIAQTRSFASMYVATACLAALLAGRAELLDRMSGLPPCGDRLLREYQDLARSLGGDLGLDRFYFLGSGPRYGLACEANLKMKEMSLTHSEPFHSLEFRHGPKSMAGPSALVVGLLSEGRRSYELPVLREARQLGARTLVLGESASGDSPGDEICFASGVPEEVRNVLYLPVLQLLACYRACAKGLNPDRPHNLDAVVRLE